MDMEQLTDEILNALTHIHTNRRKNRHKQDGTAGRGGFLHYLYEHDGTASPGDLCSHFGVTTPRVTAVLNELEREQLITREVADSDRRRICVRLTSEGRESVEKRQQKKRDEVAQLIDRLGEEDARALLRICHVIEEMQRLAGKPDRGREDSR